MGRTFEHFWEGAYHAAVERMTLFLVLFVILTIWGWLNNRRFKTSERSGTVPWALIFIAFGLVLVLRTFGEQWMMAIAISVAVLVAGFMGRSPRERDLWLPAMLLAALVGTGYLLSAAVLTLVGSIALLFMPRR